MCVNVFYESLFLNFCCFLFVCSQPRPNGRESNKDIKTWERFITYIRNMLNSVKIWVIRKNVTIIPLAFPFAWSAMVTCAQNVDLLIIILLFWFLSKVTMKSSIFVWNLSSFAEPLDLSIETCKRSEIKVTPQEHWRNPLWVLLQQ